MHENGHMPLDGKPIKDRFGFDQLQKSGEFRLIDFTFCSVFETSGAPFQKEIKARAVEDVTFLE